MNYCLESNNLSSSVGLVTDFKSSDQPCSALSECAAHFCRTVNYQHVELHFMFSYDILLSIFYLQAPLCDNSLYLVPNTDRLGLSYENECSFTTALNPFFLFNNTFANTWCCKKFLNIWTFLVHITYVMECDNSQ